LGGECYACGMKRDVYMCGIHPGINGVIHAQLFYAHNRKLAVSGTLFYCLDQLSRGQYTLVKEPQGNISPDEAVVDEPWHIDIGV
jgi:hypothetical protein